MYSGGVLTTAGSRDLYSDYNHYIAIVGWGTQNGYDYWLIKNSWGTEWGEAGFAKLARRINNRGINTVVSYAEAAQQSKNYNQTVINNVPGGGGAVKVYNIELYTFIVIQIVMFFNI